MNLVQTLAELPFVAGDPALDFVNTAEQRGHPLAGDVLHTSNDLRVWGERYELLSGPGDRGDGADGGDDADEFARALEARELLYRLFCSRAHGRADDPADLGRLAELTAEAYRAGRLEPLADGRVGWRWSPTALATVRHVAVAAATALLESDKLPRLKQCPGDHCGWLFLDTTKRGNRRWCQMSECGQAEKSARRRRSARNAG
jgi:predicted RNA-binding Zn ribbon-like protein